MQQKETGFDRSSCTGEGGREFNSKARCAASTSRLIGLMLVWARAEAAAEIELDEIGESSSSDESLA